MKSVKRPSHGKLKLAMNKGCKFLIETVVFRFEGLTLETSAF